MKRFLLIVFIIAIKLVSQAQPFGNEWIDYSQVHFKIKVPADGRYRITGSVLASAIPNLSSLNPASFVMYHNGQTVPILVSTTGSIGANDFIEFYAKHNIGDLDSTLYNDGSVQPHIYFSLFTDTSIYYLTIKSGASNPRFTSTPNNLSSLPPKENYFIFPSRQFFTGNYIAGQYYFIGQEELFKSTFDVGEGYGSANWFGSFSNGSQVVNQSFNIPTPSVFATGPAATYQTVYLNYSPVDNHQVQIQLNLTPLISSPPVISGFKFNRLTTQIPANQLGTTNNIIFSEQQSGSSSQQNVVMYNEIDYPHSFDLGGQNTFYFTLDADNGSGRYLEITNFTDNGLQPVLYDWSNGYARIITSTQSPGTYTVNSPLKFYLPSSSTPRELFLTSADPSTINFVSSLQPVAFQNYSAANFSMQGDYLIISDSSLDVNGDVTAYRNYRDYTSSPSTGKYNARIYNIEQLYDQFAYGVRKSPNAIRNFIQYALATWSSSTGPNGTGYKPKYVFLIGKGREYPSMRFSDAATKQCLVPTFGYPGSDNLLAATRHSDLPTVSIGRLAAQRPQQVSDYLAKMKDYEIQQSIPLYGSPLPQDIPPKIWQKQVLHFSGGSSNIEQFQFHSYLAADSTRVVDTLWGAHVTTYSKTTNEPISQELSQVIKGQINQGVSLISFFGHSATGAFDFSIDEPENYTNYQKYPVIVSNGCFSGFIHDVDTGYSERFVLEANKGAIAFMATSSLSLADGLNTFTSNLYNNLSGPKYFSTFGSCVRQTLNNVYSCCSGNTNAILAAYEMTLHGDPGLMLNQYPKPDYALDQTGASVYFTPSTITPNLDSFKVNVIVTNLGKAIRDTISVSLTRKIFDENGNPLPPFIYKKSVKGAYYIDTVSFTIPTRVGINGLGENQFSPYLDADFKIDEMDERNNGSNPVSINIQSDDIIPIYPYEFAIDSDRVVTLKASTTNTFAARRTYDFEIDTTQLFNTSNPLIHQTGTVTQIGGVVHWTPTIAYHDSVVYYWRVKIDTSLNNWHYTSFEHINGQYGWNQSHLFQWLKDDYVTLKLDSLDRTFKFPQNVNNVHVVSGYTDAAGGGPQSVPYYNMGWNLNNSDMYRYRMGGCGFSDGITFAVIDTINGVLQSMNFNGDEWGDQYGNYHCSVQAQIQYGFDFATAGTHPAGNGTWSGLPWSICIKNFITAIPAGAYVLIYSTNRPDYTQWDATLLSALSGLGFTQSVGLQNGSSQAGPFIFFTQKGNGAYTPVYSHFDGYNTGPTGLQADINFNARWFKGIMTSPVVGPAKSWSKMQWRHHAMEALTYDKDTVDIFGITNTGAQMLLTSTVINDNSIANINAVTYPYLQLRLRTEDDTTHTPTQLQYWRVLYQKAPEAAMNPAAWFKFTDSVSLGGNLNLEIGLENVTRIRMDSMMVKYTVRDVSSANTTSFIKYSPLPGLDTLILKFSKPITTNNYQGINKLIVEANPNGPNGDQIEQYHFNNFAEINFTGIGDKSNPLLDVTFDGQHIFNGDIISSKPDILIALRDNSKFFPLNDTSDIDIYIKYPGTTVPVRIAYDPQVLKFFPADSTNLAHGNKAQAEYKPNYLQDGTYELMVKDRNHNGSHSSSENRSESNTFYDYKISFEVINKAMITNVLNYPNPFTTQTKFVFTITGSEVPDIMKIQIINIKGTVVKEINKDELGSIHIGRNITDYAWDGRDQYGDALANGVYFYHVITRLDNKNMDQMGMSYDKYFKKGFGKMVMIR